MEEQQLWPEILERSVMEIQKSKEEKEKGHEDNEVLPERYMLEEAILFHHQD